MDRFDELLKQALKSLPSAPADAAMAKRISARASARPQRHGMSTVIVRACAFALTPWPEDMLPKSAALGALSGVMFVVGALTAHGGAGDAEAALLSLIFADLETLEVL